MAMRCHFIVAAALVSLARTTDQVAEQAQRYAQVRHHATALYEHLATETNEQDKHILKAYMESWLPWLSLTLKALLR